jgi:hypothetical protein
MKNLLITVLYIRIDPKYMTPFINVIYKVLFVNSNELNISVKAEGSLNESNKPK